MTFGTGYLHNVHADKAAYLLDLVDSLSHDFHQMSRLMGKPTMWFSNRYDINQSVQAQDQARSLKFWIQEEEELYYPCSEIKA